MCLALCQLLGHNANYSAQTKGGGKYKGMATGQYSRCDNRREWEMPGGGPGEVERGARHWSGRAHSGLEQENGDFFVQLH